MNPEAGEELELRIPEAALERADLLLIEAGIHPGHPFLCLAPGGPTRAVVGLSERLARAIRLFRDVSPVPFVILGDEGAAELSEPILERSGPDGVISLAGRTSVEELAAIIARCRLLIGCDPQALGIARALGTPALPMSPEAAPAEIAAAALDLLLGRSNAPPALREAGPTCAGAPASGWRVDAALEDR